MKDFGDRSIGCKLYFHWGSSDRNGGAADRTTAGEIRVFKDDGTAYNTSGVTDTASFAGVTGLNCCKIDTSVDATFYAAGHDYSVDLIGAVIDTKTQDVPLAHFSLNNRRVATITPVTSTVSVGEVVSDNFTVYQYAALSATFTVVDANGVAVDVSGKAITLKIYWLNTDAVRHTLDDSEIVVGGDSSNTVTVTGTDQYTQVAGTFGYVLWNTTDDTVLAKGRMTVKEVPSA
jgi:hypothetical protein